MTRTASSIRAAAAARQRRRRARLRADREPSTCRWCGRHFHPQRSSAQYCSTPCRTDASSLRQRALLRSEHQFFSLSLHAQVQGDYLMRWLGMSGPTGSGLRLDRLEILRRHADLLLPPVREWLATCTDTDALRQV